MFGTALPIAAGSLVEAAGNPALRQVHGERAVGTPILKSLIGSREAAADWRDAGGLHLDIALARLMLAETDNAARRSGHLALAEAALRGGLGLAPMSPYGWMRLVQVRTMRERPAADIGSPLRLALRSGPRENRRDAMLLLTLAAGLRVWDGLDGRERRLIADNAREAWRRDAVAAASAAAQVGETARLARLLGF